MHVDAYCCISPPSISFSSSYPPPPRVCCQFFASKAVSTFEGVSQAMSQVCTGKRGVAQKGQGVPLSHERPSLPSRPSASPPHLPQGLQAKHLQKDAAARLDDFSDRLRNLPAVDLSAQVWLRAHSAIDE